jgi:hypothetical protein
VLEKETYAGEALIETIKSGDHRYITYAVDLALTVDTEQGSGSERIVRVAFLNGLMITEAEQLRTTNYTIRSGDQTDRELVIEHPRIPSYELVKPEKPLETTPGHYRLTVKIPAGKTVTFPVLEKTIASTSVGDRQRLHPGPRAVPEPQDAVARDGAGAAQGPRRAREDRRRLAARSTTASARRARSPPTRTASARTSARSARPAASRSCAAAT